MILSIPSLHSPRFVFIFECLEYNPNVNSPNTGRVIFFRISIILIPILMFRSLYLNPRRRGVITFDCLPVTSSSLWMASPGNQQFQFPALEWNSLVRSWDTWLRLTYPIILASCSYYSEVNANRSSGRSFSRRKVCINQNNAQHVFGGGCFRVMQIAAIIIIMFQSLFVVSIFVCFNPCF